jgi:hypothetical protein
MDVTKSIYNTSFNSMLLGVSAVSPLSSFITNLAYCADLEVVEQFNLGRTLDKNILIKNLKNDARKTSISDMKIPVKFKEKIFGKKIRINLGTITLPGDLIIGHAIDYVFSRTDVNTHISNIVDKGNEIAREQRERDIIQAKIDYESINEENARKKMNNLFTGKDLGVSINSPEEGITYDDEADLHVVLSGANKSFVEFKLGIPKRVKLYINGNEYNYSGEDWAEDGEKNLVFKATLSVGGVEPIKPINNPVHGFVPGFGYKSIEAGNNGRKKLKVHARSAVNDKKTLCGLHVKADRTALVTEENWEEVTCKRCKASMNKIGIVQKIPGNKYVIIPKPIQFQRIAEFERFAIRKWYSLHFRTIEEHRELFYFCYWPPYGWPGYKPRNEPVLHPGLNIVHVVVANGEEDNERSAQAVQMFYLKEGRE